MHDGHCCGHHHHHHNEGASSMEEAKALLKYMAEHNKTHTAELADVAEHFEGSTQDMINAAIESYAQGNTMLEQALAAIGE